MLRKTTAQRCLLFLFLFLFLFLPQLTFGGDLSLEFKIDDSKIQSGDMAQGVLRLTLFNQTVGDLSNVELRLDGLGPDFIENGVIPFGTIPVNENREKTTFFEISGSKLTGDIPIQWIVDYDDAHGTHYQTVITANQ